VELKLNDPIFVKLIELAASLNVETYVVGGFVRDLLLKRDSKDLDIVVVGDGIAFAQAFAAILTDKTDFAVFKKL
jgi:poly(A) polymerase